MFITLQDSIIQTVTLGAPSTGVLSPATNVCRCGDFFIRHFLFHHRKKVFSISTQQYYDFQNLLIVELLDYLIFFHFFKFNFYIFKKI